jgi:two-component system sensor histidine kinase/response regulator
VKASIVRYLLWLALGLDALVGKAQNSSQDRVAGLFNKLQVAKEDTDRVKIYYSISRYYWDKDPDSTLLMGQKSLDLATAAHYEQGMALAWLTMGVAYGTKGMYPEALDCHLKALRLSEKLNLVGLMENDYTDIAIIYYKMQDYPRALDYFRHALQIARQFPDQSGWAIGFLNIGDVLSHEMQLDSAITYTTEALHIAEKLHDSSLLSNSFSNLGEIYTKKHQSLQALTYFKRSLRISQAIHDDEGVSDTHNSMADAWRQLGQYKRSIDDARAGLQEAQALHTNETIKTSYHILYEDYLDLKDFQRALAYRNLEIGLNDSMYNLKKDKQIKMLQSDYELEKKQHQVDVLKKDSLSQQQELEQGKIKLYLIIGGSFLLIIWAFFLIRGNRQINRVNRLLEIRNGEIVRRNEELGELNAVKNKLLSIIGHDLRSPISTLIGFVDLLRNADLPPDKVHYFSSQMADSLKQTSNLLDNLLFWARTQMEGLQADARSFDLVPLLEQNRRLTLSRAQEKKITVLTAGTDVPVMAYADEVMIDMVIRNLVDNALKFSRENDTVRLLITFTPENVAITISDTGLGIPLENQHRIFTSISYTTTGTSREKGSGLGLSLCKEMIDKNGGKIWFDSEPGKGTSFTFTLPGSKPPSS